MNEQELKEWEEFLKALYKNGKGRMFTLERCKETITETKTSYNILKYCMEDVWEKKTYEVTTEHNYATQNGFSIERIDKLLEKNFLQNKTSDIYFTPQISHFKGARENNNVKYFTCLYADIDHATIEEAETRLKNSVLPEPSVKISSGHGMHIYWILEKNVWANDWKDTWLKAQYFITDELKSDNQVNQACKVMRLPFTYNNKEETRIKTKIIYKNLDNTVDLLQFYNTYLKQQSLSSLKEKTHVKKKGKSPTADNSRIKLSKFQQKKQDKRLDKNKKKTNRKNTYAIQLKKDIKKVIETRNKQEYNWEGCRHNVCVMLHVLDFDEDYIRHINEVFELSEKELNDILEWEHGGNYMAREKIYRTLNLEREEVEELGLVMLISEFDAVLKSNNQVLEKGLRYLTKAFRDYYFHYFVKTRLESKKSKADIARELGFIDSNKKPNATEINRVLKKDIQREKWIDELIELKEKSSKVVDNIDKSNEETYDKELVTEFLKNYENLDKLEQLVNNHDELTASNKFKVTVLKGKYNKMKELIEEIVKDDNKSAHDD